MKAKSLIVSLILIVCFAGIGIGLYCAWPAITGTITDSKYYTSEDLQDAYDKGYDDAFKNKDELTQQVDYYKELTDTYYISILDYQAQIKDYETLTENNQNTISTLEQNKTELQSQVDNLTTIKNNNEEIISDLQVEVSNLENQVKILTNSDSGKAEEIAELNKQITSLNKLISQLQNTNTLNVNTIASLNSQIESLNSQISNMTLQNQNANSQITALNNKISELQESINYYEQYIASLENGEQVVATFEFDGSVYNIQIVNKNSIVTVTTPTSTDYVIFNFWTVNGEQVDLSSYQITTNTKFVADVTYKYDVVFKVDNADYDSQVVIENGYATLPEEPTKTGYEFDGWSLNGVDVVENISSTAVTQNVTYQAVFTKLHTVTFMYEEEVKSTQQVRNGEYATDVEVENTNYKVFNGWKLNGSFVDIESYKINADTVFVADVTYKYDVVFKVDNADYDSQIVVESGYATLPEEPTKNGYSFVGWSLDNSSVIDVTNNVILENTTYYALFVENYTVNFMVDNSVYQTQNVIKNGSIIIPSSPVKENYTFLGWSLNGVDVVDISTLTVSGEMTFTAIFKANNNIATFVMIDGNNSTIEVLNGSKITSIPTYTGTVPEHKVFAGWSIDGVNVVDFNTFVLTSDTTFNALFVDKEKYSITDFSSRQQYGGYSNAQSLSNSTFASFGETASYVSFTLTISAYQRYNYTSSNLLGTISYNITFDNVNNDGTYILTTSSSSRQDALKFTLHISFVGDSIVAEIINYDKNNAGTYDPDKYDEPCGIEITLTNGYYEV